MAAVYRAGIHEERIETAGIFMAGRESLKNIHGRESYNRVLHGRDSHERDSHGKDSLGRVHMAEIHMAGIPMQRG
jgi:hypothetical protein